MQRTSIPELRDVRGPGRCGGCINIEQPGGWFVTVRLWSEVNSLSRFLISHWAKTIR